MKKIIALTLAVIMLFTVMPTSVWAFDQYVVYDGRAGCQLIELSFQKADNAWLLWDVAFDTYCDGRVLETAKDHPNMVGRTVIPTFTFEGSTVTFNGETVESGVSEIVLKDRNELVVFSDSTRAEYEVVVTEETNGLPVVLIDTDGAPIPDKVNYVDAKISVLDADIYGGDDILAATAGIKLRGNSTMGYDKKPYRIKFDKKQNIFGLGKAKSWVLLANYLDPSGIRNDIAYAFGELLSKFTAETTGFQVYVPRTRPVEVYLNGEFQGLYDMGDHVQVDGTRIDIDESGEEFDDETGEQLYPEGNVGYYLEIEDPSRVIPEWYSENAYYVTIENSGGTGYGTLYTGNLKESGSLETAGSGTLDTLYVQIKTPEVPSQEQVDYIRDYLQNVNDLILARDERVFDYIDIDGFIDWYLINEIYKNTDSGFLSSVKMFKDKDGKLFMGPVWDFDIGSGAVAYSYIDDPTGWRTRDTDRCAWYDNLFKMDTFVEAVEKRWADIRDNGIVDSIFTDLDGLESYLGGIDGAAADNWDLWHDSYVNAVNNTSWLSTTDRCLNGSWADQIQTLRAYMSARIQWMDSEFNYTTSDEAAYVNMLSSALSTTSSSKTFTINKSFNVKEMPNLYLSVYSRNSFDITFNFDVGSPSLSSDWQGSDPLLPFNGTTGQNIAAGTYTNVELNLDGYMKFSSDPGATTITLNSITVTTSGSSRSVKINGLYASNKPQDNVSSSTTTTIGGEVYIVGEPLYGNTLTAETMSVYPYGATVKYQWYADGTAVSGATSQIFKNADSQMQSSIYFYKDGTLDEDGNAKENPNTKLYMAPVWDFDLGAGGVSYGEMDDPTEWRTRNDEYCGWFRELFEMPTFQNAVEARWADLHEEGILEAMFSDIDDLTEAFADAAPANYALWHDEYIRETENTSWMTVPEVSYTGDWAAQVSYLDNWLAARIAWMDEQYGYAPATPDETVEVDAVLFDNEVFTAPSAGKVSKTYPVDHKMNVDELAFDLDITTTAKFDFAFDFTVAAKINGQSVTINLTPAAKNDWQSAGNVFDGENGKYIAAGTYSDRVMNVAGALKWHISTYYLDGASVSTADLAKYVTSIRLNSVTVKFEDAKAGDTATFRLVNEDADGNHATITKTKVSGKPVIMGEGAVGNTLTVSNVAVSPFDATLMYQWYRNGSAISGATGTTYQVTASDLGKNLTVEATGTAFYSGTVTSDAVAITLDGTTAATASKPTLSSVTTDTVVVSTKSGYEYSLDGKTWQTSGVFSNLTAGKAYNVYARVAATSTAKASAASDALIVVTDVLGLIRYDVDASGEVNTSDVVLVLEQALEFISLHDAVSGECDVNGDGVVNTSDARALLCEIVGYKH